MRAARALLAAIGGCALVAAAAIGLAAGDISAAGWVLVGPAPFYIVRLVVAVRRPDHRTAIWLLAAGVSFAVGVCLGDAVLPLLAHWPGAWMIGLSRGWVTNAGALAVMAAIGLFPGGLPRRPGERWVLRAGAVLAATVPVLYAVSHRELARMGFDDPGASSIASPLFVREAVWSSTLTGGLFYIVEWMPTLGLVMLFLRYRRSPPEDRRRIRWLLVGGSFALAPTFSASAGACRGDGQADHGTRTAAAR